VATERPNILVMMRPLAERTGLPFESEHVCVVIAWVTVPRAIMSRPDVLIRPGLVSVRAWIGRVLIETKGQAHVRQAYREPARSA